MRRCLTPGAIYGSHVGARRVALTVDFPHDLDLDPEVAVRLERRLHDAGELVLAPCFAAVPERGYREAIAVAAEVLHDADCDDGDTSTCGRWKSGNYPPGRLTHVEFYRERATAALAAAAPLIAAAERERIAALADKLCASYLDASELNSLGEHARQPFADLLREVPS